MVVPQPPPYLSYPECSREPDKKQDNFLGVSLLFHESR
jgi:hypothetical protein